jgi:hypothetical protein
MRTYTPTADNQARKITRQLPAFIKARIEELHGSKDIETVARECGFKDGRTIETILDGRLLFPLPRLRALARALDVPLLPLFKLAMNDVGMGELADAICELVEPGRSTSQDPPVPSSDTESR